MLANFFGFLVTNPSIFVHSKPDLKFHSAPGPNQEKKKWSDESYVAEGCISP